MTSTLLKPRSRNLIYAMCRLRFSDFNTSNSRISSQHNLIKNAAVAQLHTGHKCMEVFNIQDEEDFKTRVLQNKKAVVVDFHAKWCGPCKLLMPRLESAVAATKGQMDLAKVDIDDHPEIAMNYNVGAVPSVLAMKEGEVVDKFVGLKDDDQIGTFISTLSKK